MNVLNGGAHAGWVMDIQECMIVPRHKQFSERVRIGVEVFQSLGKLLKEKHLPITVGDEGGFFIFLMPMQQLIFQFWLASLCQF
jgi:enolase